MQRVNLRLASVAVAAILFLCPRMSAKQEKTPAPQAPASQATAPQASASQRRLKRQEMTTTRIHLRRSRLPPLPAGMTGSDAKRSARKADAGTLRRRRNVDGHEAPAAAQEARRISIGRYRP